MSPTASLVYPMPRMLVLDLLMQSHIEYVGLRFKQLDQRILYNLICQIKPLSAGSRY